MRRQTLILLFLLTGSCSFGQQLPLYSQYLYNKFLINPAVAGSDGYTNVSLTAREQWVGYYGAPRTFSFSVQTRMLKKQFSLTKTHKKRQMYRPKSDGKVGFGGYVFSDKNGLVQRTGFNASYAYHTWLQQSTQFSMGLAFTGFHYKINEKEINFENPDEPLLNSNLRRGVFVPDVSFGAYLLNPKYCMGFSAAQLFEASAKIGSSAYNNLRMSRHYYIFGSYDLSSGPYHTIQPSFLFMMSEQFRPQVDIGVTYVFNQVLWTGLSFRTSGAIIADIAVHYQNMLIGYAFDFTLQEIQRITYGTHEFTVALKFGDSKRKYRWLDRY